MAARGEAQQKTRVYRIAALLGGSTANAPEIDLIEKFFKGFGWSPGRDLEIAYRWGAGDTELNKAYAKEIIGMKPDAILASAVPNGSLRVIDVAETRQTTISRKKYRVRRRQQISCKPQFAGIATPRPATTVGKLSNPIAEREKRNATPAP